MNNENAAELPQTSSHMHVILLHVIFIAIIIISICIGVKYLYYVNDFNKIFAYFGLVASIAGTYMAGPLANGIPVRGDKIKAPQKWWSVSGWLLIMLGFLASAIGNLQIF